MHGIIGKKMIEQEVKVTKFNSPLPLLIQARNFLYGKQKPDVYTRVTAYVNTLIFFLFLLWHVLSFSVISLREIIKEHKAIDVEALIFARGEKLGYRPYYFLENLMQFHLLAIISWGIVFVGILFIWRKKRFFAWFFIVAFAVYFASLFNLLGVRYFNEDILWFDKILWIVFACNSIAYLFFLNLEKRNKMREILISEEDQAI